MKFYAPFCLPFLVGALVMAAVIAWKYVVWFAELPRADKKRVLFGIPTPRTLGAVGEVIGECLLHRRIFRVNPLLGYMHMSLAFGWFLLIVVGWIETVAYLGLRWVPLQGHVFFKYFAPTLMLREKPFFDFVMDLLLLFVLSGVALAWAKRFFVALPFSRYMHIFTEIPLIFLRRYGVRPREKESSADRFQIEACSRCGICIDPCQLQSVLGIDDVQSVYFLRDRRYGMLTREVAQNCLMCGRCQAKCPVGIDLNTLRLNSRDTMRNTPDERRYDYFKGLDRSEGEGKVGYFAGCMTLLTPRTMTAMERIFTAAGEEVWWADRNGGVCCGRPLKLSGETDSARRMMEYNTQLFRRHGIRTLVTSCPICLKVFREEYRLDGIRVIHHSQYILELLSAGRLRLERGAASYAYHDPCELGRGSGIYDEPRAVIEAVGELLEPASTRENALCCGSSVANTAISDGQQVQIARSVAAQLDATGAEVIVTACPLCKKAIGRGTKSEVRDLAEIVVAAIK